MAKKRSIGLLCMVKDPESNEHCALLQIRGRINDETGGPESYPGGAQVTIHGSVETGEKLKQTLLREVREEIAAVLHHLPIAHLPNAYRPENGPIISNPLQLLSRITSTRKQAATMGCWIDDPELFQFLNEVLPKPEDLPFDGPSLRLVRESELNRIQIIDPSDPNQKNQGFTQGTLALFADEKDAVEKAFKITKCVSSSLSYTPAGHLPAQL